MNIHGECFTPADRLMTTANTVNGRSASVSVNSIPTAVVAYEDTPTGLRAVHALDGLPLFAATHGKFVRRLWRWDLLRPLWLSEQAAREASTADVLVISAHGSGEFPPEVQLWLNCWLTNSRSHACAFALLLDHEPIASDGPNRMLVFARHIADCAGVNLLYGFNGTIYGGLEPPASLCSAAGPFTGARRSSEFRYGLQL
jgi:hypothetical protein